jgi:hypothetical protein
MQITGTCASLESNSLRLLNMLEILDMSVEPNYNARKARI